MRFKLLTEGLPNVPEDATIKFNRADDKTRREIIKRLLLAYRVDGLAFDKNIFNATYKSAMNFGLNVRSNIFLQFLDKYTTAKDSKRISYSESELFPEVVEIMSKTAINIDNPYLVDPRLYKLNKNDFNYVFKVFNLLADKNKLKDYFKDLSVINIAELFKDNNISKDLKPAGIGKRDDTSTIFGTIEKWSTANEPFDIRDIDLTEDDYQKIYYFLKDMDINTLKGFTVGKELFNDGTELTIGSIAYARDSQNSTNGSFYYLSNTGWKKFTNAMTKRIILKSAEEAEEDATNNTANNQ